MENNILFYLKPKEEVTYLYEDEFVQMALERIDRVRFSAVPVLDRKSGRYVGTVSEGDFLRFFQEKYSQHYPEEKLMKLPVSQVKKSRNIEAVHVNARANDLLDKLVRQNFVPVVDDESRFIGIVTRMDVLESFIKAWREKS